MALPDLHQAAAAGAADIQVLLGVRPESLRLTPAGSGTWEGRVASVELRGSEAVVTVDAGSLALKVLVPAPGRPGDGEAVGLAIEAGNCMLFNAEDGRRMASLDH
ncbi:hypothetical protein CLD22_28140 [Rubrivivax gelatinosus]|nr:hypothetical protein [Rubrivivax gelatinosus]